MLAANPVSANEICDTGTVPVLYSIPNGIPTAHLCMQNTALSAASCSIENMDIYGTLSLFYWYSLRNNTNQSTFGKTLADFYSSHTTDHYV